MQADALISTIAVGGAGVLVGYLVRLTEVLRTERKVTVMRAEERRRRS